MLQRCTAYCVIVLCPLALVTPTFGATLTVPGEYGAIQAGINAASHYDTVLVFPGRYVENIDFLGKAIVVKSHSGPLLTVIDGGMTSSVVRFRNGEGEYSVLEGFTLTKGGGAVNGGGVHCSNASPTILHNWIVWNVAGGGSGGGICCDSSSAPMLFGNVIAHNTAGSSGEGQGGGVVSYDASPILINNLIAWNRAWQGGGVCLYAASHCLIENCTIYGNTATTAISGASGGGLLCGHYSEATVRNSIFWANESDLGPQICINSTDFPSSVNISYCDVAGGEADIYVPSNWMLQWGSGMFDLSPRFTVGPAGNFYLSHIAAGQGEDSPCIDSGSDLASNLCGTWTGGFICMDGRSTRTDQVNDAGQVDVGYHPAGLVEWQSVGVPGDPEGGQPVPVSLLRAMPNPCHASATIRFEVTASGPVSLQISDPNGRLIRNLIRGRRFESGIHDVWWDGRDNTGRSVGSGVYFYRLRSSEQDSAERIVVIR